MSTVFLLTTGDGSYGNEWGVQSIHSTRELAEIAQVKYSEPQYRRDGSSYVRESEIEEWAIDEAAQPVNPANAACACGSVTTVTVGLDGTARCCKCGKPRR